MSANPTEQASDTSALPSPDELAWTSEVLAIAASKIVELEDYLAPAFQFDPVDGQSNVYQHRREFEPLTLEDLGRLLLLVNEARESAETINDQATKIEQYVLRLYQEQNSGNVVAGIAGVESYADYRRRVAEGHRAAADQADEILEQLQHLGSSAA